LDGRPETPPIAVTGLAKNAIRIVALEDHASRQGIQQGQSLSDARALVPGLEYWEHDEDADKALLHAIAAWCERYTPLVALSGEDGLFMDITGCTHLFGGEACLVAGLAARLNAQGLSIRLSIADTPGAAWAMARYGTQRVIDEGAGRGAISGLAVAALRLDPATVTSLNRVGLKTIGCLANLPRAPLAARFGFPVLRRLDQALGREDEVISPLMPVAELTSEKRFADPIVYEDDIKRTLGILADNLTPLLERRGLGARECRVKLFRVDGDIATLSVQTANPLRDAGQIARLFEERLAALHDGFDAGFGFDVIRLEVCRTDPFEPGQGSLTEDRQSGYGYDALIDRLGARLGTDRIRHFILADTHIPERSFGTAPVVQDKARDRTLCASSPGQDVITRPLILLQSPELVETISQVPEDPPIRFRWRKVFYDVARSEGPERIACEWWQDGRGSHTRDYFRVEDGQGYRFWMFRNGLYGRETTQPKWYMHGLFA